MARTKPNTQNDTKHVKHVKLYTLKNKVLFIQLTISVFFNLHVYKYLLFLASIVMPSSEEGGGAYCFANVGQYVIFHMLIGLGKDKTPIEFG